MRRPRGPSRTASSPMRRPRAVRASTVSSARRVMATRWRARKPRRSWPMASSAAGRTTALEIWSTRFEHDARRNRRESDAPAVGRPRRAHPQDRWLSRERCGTRSDEAALSRITWPKGLVAAAAAPATGRVFPPLGNMAQLMRGIFFPNSNLIFTVQTRDPGAKPEPAAGGGQTGGFSFVEWGAGIYGGWELIDNAAIALADASPLMLDARHSMRERTAGAGDRSRLDQVHRADDRRRAKNLPGVAVAKTGGRCRRRPEICPMPALPVTRPIGRRRGRGRAARPD